MRVDQFCSHSECLCATVDVDPMLSATRTTIQACIAKIKHSQPHVSVTVIIV